MRARYFLGETRQAGKSGSNNTRNIVESSKRSRVMVSSSIFLSASPRLASPRLASPRLASPRLASPCLASPRHASPRLALLRLALPRLASLLATIASSLFSREHHIHTDRPQPPLPLTKAPEKPHPRNSSTLYSIDAGMWHSSLYNTFCVC
ncbi:hypothetical protein ALC53_11846 [Atta colombica]|uniref:Uncharacterized protein n=1 Tax=Atta colombica TaxID=520822 RepID=A0A195B0L9_9HYME|nr:hypothetical protein ALC53_11846 [Atta colombica]